MVVDNHWEFVLLARFTHALKQRSQSTYIRLIQTNKHKLNLNASTFDSNKCKVLPLSLASTWSHSVHCRTKAKAKDEAKLLIIWVGDGIVARILAIIIRKSPLWSWLSARPSHKPSKELSLTTKQTACLLTDTSSNVNRDYSLADKTCLFHDNYHH